MDVHQRIVMKNKWNKMHVKHSPQCLAQTVLATALPRSGFLLLLLRRMLLLYACSKGSQICLNQTKEVPKYFIQEQYYFNHQQIPDTLVTSVRVWRQSSNTICGRQSWCQNDHNRIAISDVWNTTLSLASLGSALTGLEANPLSYDGGDGRNIVQ